MQSPTQSSLRTRPENQVSRQFSQQLQIVEGNRRPSLAFAGMPNAEPERNFSGRSNSSSNQDLQQQFEPLGLEAKAINCCSTNHEKARHRIFDSQVSSLQRKRSPCAHARDCGAYRVPVAYAIFCRIAAGDCDIATVGDGCQQVGKKLRGMLKISVNDTEQTSVRVLPA